LQICIAIVNSGRSIAGVTKIYLKVEESIKNGVAMQIAW